MRHRRIFLLIVAVLTLCGCGADHRQVVTITHPAYEKINYRTTEVQRGDLTTSMTVKLTAEGYMETVYRAPKDEFALEEVYVSVGDRVEKGDILVSFESEKIRRTIADYEDEISTKELLVQHYENLMQADKDRDYEADIMMLREDMQVARLYIEEAEKLLAGYQIVAEDDGIITDISDYLQNKVTEPGVELVTLVSGTGRYLATVSDVSMFVVGDVYTADGDGIEYELRLAQINDKTLIFEPVFGMKILSANEFLMLSIELPKQENVVYVNRHAVCTIKGDDGEDNAYCVYVMQENGYQRAVFVTPGERIGENIVIAEGLEGGEKVVIR